MNIFFLQVHLAYQLEKAIEAGLPDWVKKDNLTGEDLVVAMLCWLLHQMPSDLDAFPQRPQPLHCDVGPPATLEAFQKFLDGKIAITAGPEPVLLWVVPGSPPLVQSLIAAHLRHGPPDLLDPARAEQVAGKKGRKKIPGDYCCMMLVSSPPYDVIRV